MAITVDDPMHLDLTEGFLRNQGLPPLVAGDDWSIRLSARDSAGLPLSLTGALIVMHVRARSESETVLLVRSSANLISGTSILQITPDADQSAENTTDPVNPTGKSWYTVRFSDEDEASMLAAVGKGRVYGIRIKFADATERTQFQGLIDILRPIVRPSL